MIIDRGNLEPGAAFLAQELPGHDVRMVFQVGDENLVAGLDKLSAKASGNQIDAFGGAAHKDDLTHVAGSKEAANLLARSLIVARGLFAEHVDAAMDVGVAEFVVIADSVDHDLGLLRRRGIVEINERFAVHKCLEYRKILTDCAGR